MKSGKDTGLTAPAGRGASPLPTPPAPDGHATRDKWIIPALVWVLRVVVGATFVFSGWVKAIDPWGTLYKLTEYFAAMGMTMPHEVTLIASCLLAAVEFTVGVMLIFGIARRVSAWLTLAFMAVMTPITAWIFIADPVSDCGCFGDAVILSNGATFAKNILLLAASIALVLFNRRAITLVSRRLQWIAIVVSVLYPAYLSAYGYLVQPLVDFRPYKVGEPLLDDTDGTEGLQFVYSKDGIEQTFTVDNLPDDSWEFVSRTDPKPQPGAKQFAIMDQDGTDVSYDLVAATKTAADATGGQDEEAPAPDAGLLLYCISDTGAYGLSRSRQANELYDYITDRGGEMVAVIPATADPEAWGETVTAKYPVYTADDTDIKALARGHAALVYVSDGVIKWKYNMFDISPELPRDNGTGADNGNILNDMPPAEKSSLLITATALPAAVMLVLTALTLLPAAMRRNGRKQDGEKDGENPGEKPGEKHVASVGKNA